MPTSWNGLKLELKGLGSEVRSKLRLGLDVDLGCLLGLGSEQPEQITPHFGPLYHFGRARYEVKLLPGPELSRSIRAFHNKGNYKVEFWMIRL